MESPLDTKIAYKQRLEIDRLKQIISTQEDRIIELKSQIVVLQAFIKLKIGGGNKC